MKVSEETLREHLKKQVVALAPFLLVAALIVVRSSAALFRAEFWAEDAGEFFPRTLDRDFSTLFLPVTGYHLFASRLIGYVAGFFPVVAIPYVYSAVSLIVGAFAISYFVRPGFSWVVDSPPGRLVVACFLAIGPGTAEVFFNLSNLQAPLTLLGFFLLLEAPHRLTRVKFVSLATIFFSSGSAPLLMPLILFLAWSKRQKAFYWLAGLLSLSTLLNWISHARYDAQLEKAFVATSHWRYTPLVLLERFFIHLFGSPFLGNEGTHAVMMTSDWVFWPLALLGYYVSWRLVRANGSWLLALAYSCAVALFAMVVVGRSYNLGGVLRSGGQSYWDSRYGFLPGVFAMLFWMAFLVPLVRSKIAWKRGLAILVLGISCLVTLSRWPQVPSRPDGRWPERAALIQAALDKKRGGTLTEPVAIGGIKIQPNLYSEMSVVISP